jgi:small-conductance mechanosensitive channel
VQALPDAKAVRAVLDQHAAVTQQFQQGLQAMDQRLAQLPDANLLRQVMQQQGLLAERLEALEVWLTRLERRLAEAPPAPAATPASQVDGLQFLLFGGLGLAVLIAVIVGLLLRFG